MHGILLEPVSGRDIIESGDRLSKYLERGRFDHPFHVPAGRRPGHGTLFPRTYLVANGSGHRRFAGRCRPPSTGGIGSRGGDTTAGTIAAAVSVFAYAGYIIGVRKSRAAQVESTTLTFYVMAFGALLFLCGGMFTGGVRLVTDGKERLAILGLALPATAISNITLVRAIKFIGPTLTSIFGALEPLTAVAIGATVFGERFGWTSALGVGLVVAAVSIVVLDTQRKTWKTTPSSST